MSSLRDRISALGRALRGAAVGGYMGARAELGHGDGIGLEAGRMGRRLGGWLPTRVHINTLISQSGLTTLARARFLARNNGYAVSAVECFSANMVGPGIVPSWKSPLDDAEKAAAQKEDVQTLFATWTDEADSEGVTDFYGIQKRVANELFVAGECFVRKRMRRASDGLSVPLQLQLLPSEMLPIFLTMPLDNGNVIRQGIEFDKIGRRVAYHFWRSHPGDMTIIPKWGERVRIPADQILHVFAPGEGGQIRGLSRLTPAIITLWMLDLYDDAELERKKTAALFSLFIKRPDPDGEFFDKESQRKLQEGVGESTVRLEPGSAQVLMPGEEIQVASPADSGHSYEPFQYRTLTRFCASVGLPYAGVTGDLVKANYGNQRAALIEARRRAEALQHGCLVFQFCRPVWKWFTDAATLADALDLDGYADDPKPFLKLDWIPPRWMWLDPLKDRQGEILAVNAGFKPRSYVIEEEGYDPSAVDQRIAEDKARAERLGLQFVGTQSVRGEIAQAPVEDDGPAAEPAPAEQYDDEPAQSPPSSVPPAAPKPKTPKTPKG